VTTPEISKERALVKVAVTLSNEGKSPRSCAVRARLVGPDGTTLVAQALTASRAMAAGQTAVMECAALVVEKPLLWHPDHPQLYSVRVTVEENGRAVDETVVKTGLRWFKFTADKGFSSTASPCVCAVSTPTRIMPAGATRSPTPGIGAM